jgi:hypothetical protein
MSARPSQVATANVAHVRDTPTSVAPRMSKRNFEMSGIDALLHAFARQWSAGDDRDRL